VVGEGMISISGKHEIVSENPFLQLCVKSESPGLHEYSGYDTSRLSFSLASIHPSIMNGQTNSSSGTSSPLRIYDARSVTFPGPTLQSDDYESFRGANTAIIIDNGIY
jgi:hypothetical protein